MTAEKNVSMYMMERNVLWAWDNASHSEISDIFFLYVVLNTMLFELKCVLLCTYGISSVVLSFENLVTSRK